MAYKLDTARILIVDDMAPMLTLCKSILNIFGFKHVFTASNGEEAFEILCKEDPDLVITDWMMEPMDGLEFTKKVRRDPLVPNPYVPIIMMTGFSSRLRVESARDKGITEFLVKPFSSRDLYNRVVQIIEKPRQFVEAGEFFGPDRRRKRGKDYTGARRRGNDEKKKVEPKTQEQKLAVDVLRKLREEAKNV
ncbi:MAG: response regulator [Micavibrio sp.]|nr:MAG: response regulator [Micavibrio sp.]